jgi:hypothetical protein
MPILPFSEWRPDVSDYQGQHSKTIQNVYPRGDGYGPVANLLAYTAALPAACRGFFYARKNDGSVQVFAGVSDRLYTLDNTTQTWKPVGKVATVTISSASPGVITHTAHPFVADDPVVFLNSGGALPAAITAGTVYYVKTVLGVDTFTIAATVGGTAINTASTGTGTHSVTSTYTALGTNSQWQFRQFNNFVFAVHGSVNPQVYDLTSSTAFADLGGSPPQAAYISIVNRFVVLSGIASPNVYRVQWSGLNATTTWTSGVTQSDSQDLADGGIVRGVAGGEFGVVFQDASIRRMTYAPGSPYIFAIDRISSDDGLFAPYSLINAGDRIFFLSPQGFKMLLPGGYPVPIGKEKFDRTVFADLDTSNLHLMIGASDPRSTRVYWAYKSVNGQTGKFDKILVYDWALERGTIISVMGEYIASLSRPGLTLEGIDAAYGSNIDTITLSSLDDVSSAAFAQLSAFGSDHKLGFFTGTNLEATMQTPEQGGDGRRIFVRGFRPITDAATVYGALTTRDTAQATATTTTETLVNAVGSCPQRVDTRYARGQVRIPAATTWTYAAGIEPDVELRGNR